jgi:hypothetical protein
LSGNRHDTGFRAPALSRSEIGSNYHQGRKTMTDLTVSDNIVFDNTIFDYTISDNPISDNIVFHDGR